MNSCRSFPFGLPVSEAPAESRSTFILRTYAHLAGAITAFAGIEAVLLNLPGIENMAMTMFQSQMSWLVVLGAFLAVSWIAEMWANNAASRATQYMGLLYVAAEAVIFVPLLYIAKTFYPGVIAMAGVTTLALTALLTLVVFVTRKDFSFLRSVVVFGGFAALGLIVVSAIFSFTLGPIFTYVMIAFACCAILYDTSKFMNRYRTDQYVAASLSLFASVALLFGTSCRCFSRLRKTEFVFHRAGGILHVFLVNSRMRENEDRARRPRSQEWGFSFLKICYNILKNVLNLRFEIFNKKHYCVKIVQ